MFENTTQRLKNISLPGIRRPNENPHNNFNQFMNNYGFVFETSKAYGNYNRYRKAFRNPYVYRCIEAEINALIQCGFTIDTPDKYDTNIKKQNYLTNLFNNPQGYSSDYTYNILLGQVIRSLELVGDAFVETNVDDNFNVVNGFRYIPASLLDYDHDRECYYYREQPNVVYEKDELIHIYEPDPLDYHQQHFGISKVDNIVTQIDLMLGILDYNNDVVGNDGLSPKAILSFDKDISDMSFESELKRLSKIPRSKKRGATLALKGASFQAPPTSNNIDWNDLMISCRDTILSNYGIPPIYLGIVETANLGTGTGESQKEVFKMVLNGRARLIEDGFNKALGRSGFREYFNIGDFDIEDKLKRTQIENQQLTSGVKTINEVRAGYHLDRVPWGDVPQNITTPLELANMDIKAYKNYVYKNNLLNYGVKND